MKRRPLLRTAGVVALLGGAAAIAPAAASPADAAPPRGLILVGETTGNVSMIAGDVRTQLAPDARVPVGAQITTAARGRATLVFSNGTRVVLAADSELAVQEFFQTPFAETIKADDLRREPSPSQVKLLLLRGELIGRVPALQHERGSRFAVATRAGELVVRATPDQNASGGRPLGEASLAAFQAGGYCVGAADGSTVFRVVYQADPATGGVLQLANGGGNLDFVILRAAGAKMAVPDQRELEINVNVSAARPPASPARSVRSPSSGSSLGLPIRGLPGGVRPPLP